jgi:hypothetical protein
LTRPNIERKARKHYAIVESLREEMILNKRELEIIVCGMNTELQLEIKPVQG